MGCTLGYHDRKLKKGKAECILAENFLKDKDKLSHKDKLAHFNRMTSLNSEIPGNTIHVSLNFNSLENISNSDMANIARIYMRKVGLDHQPFVVFRHHDAQHPHIHLVSTHIQADGSRIDLGSIIHSRSRLAAREIEKEFSLKASGQEILHSATIKGAIQNNLHKVVNDYKFTSLNEMNAVLSAHKIRADRGKEGSKMYQRRGLIYFALDERGNTQGLPINASSFSFRPTWKNLERKFVVNELERQPYTERIRQAVDWTLLSRPHDQAQLQKALEKERINLIYQRDKEGVLQGVFFVDQQSRSVFDDAALGTRYSAQAIRERCTEKQSLTQNETQRYRHRLM